VRKVLLISAVLIGSVLLWNFAKNDPTNPKQITQKKANLPSTHTITPQKIEKNYVFVPYWSFTKSITTNNEDSLIYFGLGVNNSGIDIDDKGYSNLVPFASKTPNVKERILTVRMVDKNINASVLQSLTVQENIATQAVSLALKNKFDGVILNYETSAFGFDSTTRNITSFYKLFSNKVKENNLKFYTTLYGDSYFQARPFDIKAIGEISDKVFIMAYDFSKSRSNPGPNFPLSGREKYGYDFAKMIEDYQKDVSNEKLVVTLGYFGYDWRVDGKGNSLSSGVPLSTNEITKEFITKCKFKKCSLSRNPNTSEPSIKYVDSSGENHIVWFEDEVSIAKKKEFLKTKGILETAAWAYSYF
jgi:spore germination protein YaaH